MMNTPTSGSDRQLARNKGLARISAITFGAGAAGLVGAVAIAVTLPNPTAATSANTASVAVSSSTPAQAGDDGGDDDSGTTSSTPQLQPAAPPSNTNIPPVATSGAS
jgi:hypothetical protein